MEERRFLCNRKEIKDDNCMILVLNRKYQYELVMYFMFKNVHCRGLEAVTSSGALSNPGIRIVTLKYHFH